MSDKEFASIMVRALLAIVSALCKKYGLPNSRNVTILLVASHEDGVQEPP